MLLENLSFVLPNNTSINRTNVLYIVEARKEEEDGCNDEEDGCKYQSEQTGKDCDDNGRGANLAPCACGDHISTI